MGFFSDLKEDLSQAVNELMPDELAAKKAESQENAEMLKEEPPADALTGGEENIPAELSLEEMLKNIDAIQIPEDYEAQPESVESVEPDLEAGLAVALESIPDESGNIAVEASLEEGLKEALSAVEEPEEEMMEAFPAAEWEPAAEEIVTADNEIDDKGAENHMDDYTSRQATDETAVITAGMQIKGDISSEGSVDVVGTVEGNIDVWGKLNITGHVNGNSQAAEVYAEGAKITGEIVSSGAVKIGNSSVIIGNITAKSAAIAGAVKGDIDVQGPVVLDASAIVMGNIKSKSVQINNGAVIEGMCSQCYADVSPLSFFDEYKTEIKNSKKNK